MSSLKHIFAVTAAVGLSCTVAQAQTRNASPQDVGLNVIVPNTIVFDMDRDNNSNWEGYSSKLGDGTLLLSVNTFGTDDGERTGIVAVRPDGTVEEFAGFYADDGTPYVNNMDLVRTDGNPPSVAGDFRPGSTKYIVANESTPMDFAAFGSDNRWNNDYSSHIFACQIFELTPNGPQKISNVIDPLYGGQTGEFVGVIRKGGTIALSNGNFVVMGEDRTNDRDALASIIDGNTGEIVKGPFNLDNDGYGHSAWENMTAYNGGFAVRLDQPRGAEGPVSIQFYDNDGNFRGRWDQVPVDDPDNPLFDVNNNPDGFTTTINSTNRGDHIRVRSNKDGDRIYYVGYGIDFFLTSGWVYLTVIDANTFETIANIRVNEQPEDENGYDNFSKAERVSLDIDSKGNICVAWSDSSNNDTQQVVARIFDADLNPRTESFLAFQDADLGYGADPVGDIIGVNTLHADVAMSDTQIMISARSNTGILVPGGNGTDLTKVNQNVITVFENPFAGTAVNDWSLF